MAKSRASRSTEVDRADRDPAPRTPARGAAPGPRATPRAAAKADDSTAAPRAASSTKPAAAATETPANGRNGQRRPADHGRAAARAPQPAARPSAAALSAAEAVRMERASIGLSNDERAGVSRILNRALSDEHVLYIRTRNYHWNVTGMHFKSLHEFFEEQYKQIEIAIDEIAERARALGFRALGSMTEFIQHTHLSEQNPAEVPDATGMLRNLLADHEAVIKQLREDIDACDEKFNDTGTADFLTEKLEDHEKMAWMIRAYLA